MQRQTVGRRFRAAAWVISLAAVCALPGGARAQKAEGAQPPQDIGTKMEQEFGVLGRGTPEGKRFNDQLDRVTKRITGALGYELKSAKLLGGADAKRDAVVNAFALPDGRIYVTLGLMRALQKAADPDAELAFVVGHETTHVTASHGEGQATAAAGAGIAAILLGAAVRNKAVGTIAGVGAAAYVTHFSRKDEYEADRGGVRAMHKAGYTLEAAVSMLQRLESLAGAKPDPRINGWFGTHPITKNRIHKVQAMIAQLRSPAPAAPPKPARRRRR